MPSFKTVELLKQDNDVLGVGAYGKVCKAKCDELICAAKVIHETLVDPNSGAAAATRRRHRLPLQRFVQECKYLSTIRHPNIVQYLGQWQDPDSGLPVLLMELLDGSLTSFLEKLPEGKVIPFHIQVNICHDVSLALVFLHSNGIIHRDLSGNNVLMIGNGVRAKVSDFGMARMMDNSPSGLSGDIQRTITLCPGADVYMPPEAINNPSDFSDRMDCFSFGVVTLQLLTKKFPAPGNRHKTVRHYFGRRDEIVPEVERRQSHISEVESKHPLRSIFLDCLKDKSNGRPSALQICQQLAAVKNGSQYKESVDEEPPSSVGMTNGFPGGDQKGEPSEKNGESLTKELEQQILQKDQEILKIAAEKNEIEERLRKIVDPNEIEKRGVKHRNKDKGQKGDGKVNKTTEGHNNLPEAIEVPLQPQVNDIQKEHSLVLDTPTIDESVEIDTNPTTCTSYDNEYEELTIADALLQTPVKDTTQDKEHSSKPIREVTYAIIDDPPTTADPKRRHKGGSVRSLQETAKEYNELCRLKRMLESVKDGAEGTAVPQVKRNVVWKGEGELPFTMERKYSEVAVLVNGSNNIYMACGRKRSIHAFNTASKELSKFPDCPQTNYSLAVVDGLLTTIGGSSTNKLFSLRTSNTSCRDEWVEQFPPMSLKRQWTTAICTDAYLIVIGGWREREVLKTVEVLNIRRQQWSTGAELPEPLYMASGTIDEGLLIVAGGQDKSGNPTKTVFLCSLEELIKSTLSTSSTKSSISLWSRITDLPSVWSTCILVGRCMLAIGQSNQSTKSTSSVYKYNTVTKTWEVISDLCTNRSGCFAVIRSNSQIVVLGGASNTIESTNYNDLL